MGLEIQFPLGRDEVEILHALEDDIPPPRHVDGFAEGVVAAGILGHARQEDALTVGEVFGALVEVEPGGLDEALGAVPVVDLVEVHLQDLLLGVLLFEVQGQLGFLELAIQGPGRTQELVLDQLLGDGRAALGHAPLEHILDRGAGDAAEIEAAVLIEPGILHRQERLL